MWEGKVAQEVLRCFCLNESGKWKKYLQKLYEITIILLKHFINGP
jgi:hypothetical protein